MVGMTIGETENPATVIPRAARSVILRILVFYVLPILVIVSLVPWNQLGTAGSPFVTVFQAIGIPYVGAIMNFVLLTAVLSATNTGMYAASRMLYTQAIDGQAPLFFAKLTGRHVPVRALLVSTSFLYVGVIVAFFAKGDAFNYLMVIPGYSVMMVWMLISLAHIVSRVREPGGKGFPMASVIAVLALVVIFIGVIVTSPILGTVASLLAVALVCVVYLFTRPRRDAHKSHQA
jgi:amino acid transporter, AAT family